MVHRRHRRCMKAELMYVASSLIGPDAAVDAAGCSARRARTARSPHLVAQRALDHAGVVKSCASRVPWASARHRRLRPTSRPCGGAPTPTVVPVDVATRAQLDEHLAIHAGDVVTMVEQEETAARYAPGCLSTATSSARAYCRTSRCRRSRRTRRSTRRASPVRKWRSPFAAAIASRHSCRAAASLAVAARSR